MVTGRQGGGGALLASFPRLGFQTQRAIFWFGRVANLMPKKGGKGGGKKGGAKAKAGEWEAASVPTGPLLVRQPLKVLTVVVKGAAWRVFDFTERLSSLTTVGELSEIINRMQGARGNAVDFMLYKEGVSKENLLKDPTEKICDLTFEGAHEDNDPRIFYYDFIPMAFWQSVALTVQDRNRPAAARGAAGSKRPESAAVPARRGSMADPAASRPVSAAPVGPSASASWALTPLA